MESSVLMLGAVAGLFDTFFISSLLVPLLGLVYGFFLWTVTLVPIHTPITGFHPWNHSLRQWPALASLIYGNPIVS
jgi:hypothetical protein